MARDNHGRYENLKEISTNGPSWARGCDKCKCGIASAPELTGACELYLERLVQVIDGDIQFCTCTAGTRYRVFLQNRWLFLMDEVKKTPNLSNFIGRKTHPDIEQSRIAMQVNQGAKAPPIRFVDASEPSEKELVTP